VADYALPLQAHIAPRRWVIEDYAKVRKEPRWIGGTVVRIDRDCICILRVS
jgi:hypothetical protein